MEGAGFPARQPEKTGKPQHTVRHPRGSRRPQSPEGPSGQPRGAFQHLPPAVHAVGSVSKPWARLGPSPRRRLRPVRPDAEAMTDQGKVKAMFQVGTWRLKKREQYLPESPLVPSRLCPDLAWQRPRRPSPVPRCSPQMPEQGKGLVGSQAPVGSAPHLRLEKGLLQWSVRPLHRRKDMGPARAA